MGDSMKQKASAGESNKPFQKRVSTSESVEAPKKRGASVSNYKSDREGGFIIALANAWMEKDGEGGHGDTGLTSTQFLKLMSMEPEESEWKNALLKSLFTERLIGRAHEVSLEDTLKIISMKREEQTEWRDKLMKRKTSREPQQEGHIQPESWSERLKSADHHFDKKVSLQVPMHPEMREQVAALATSYGLGSGEFVEQVLAEKLAHSSKRVKEGRELMAKEEFKRPYRAKIHALRKEIEELRQKNPRQRD